MQLPIVTRPPLVATYGRVSAICLASPVNIAISKLPDGVDRAGVKASPLSAVVRSTVQIRTPIAVFKRRALVTAAVNQRRIAYLLSQTVGIRQGPCYDLDDTLCEHVGSLFEHVERHCNLLENTYPALAWCRSLPEWCGPLPVDFALYRPL